jgi:hypothetical protein
MSKFRAFYQSRYGVEYPGEISGESAFDMMMRIAEAMEVWADECARVAESRLVRLHRAEKRLARATKIKAVSMRSLDELRDEFVKPIPVHMVAR